MSGHDPAPLVVPSLQRKERRPEEQGGSATCGERKRDHWSATAHAVKRAIKRDAARSRLRPSPNLGCRLCRHTSQRDCSYQPQVRDIIDIALSFSLLLSFSLPFLPEYASSLCKSSRKSTRAGTQSPMKP